MDIKKITFYKTEWLSKVKGAKRVCTVEFKCGLILKEIILIEGKIGDLYIKFPTKINSEKKHYSIISYSNEIFYQELREAIVNQWHKFTGHWKADDAIG